MTVAAVERVRPLGGPSLRTMSTTFARSSFFPYLVPIIQVPGVEHKGRNLLTDGIHNWFDGKAEQESSKRVALVQPCLTVDAGVAIP